MECVWTAASSRFGAVVVDFGDPAWENRLAPESHTRLLDKVHLPPLCRRRGGSGIQVPVIGQLLAACLAVPGFIAGMAISAEAAICDTAMPQNAVTPLPPSAPFAERRHTDQIARFAGVKADALLIGDSLAQRWPEPGFAGALSARRPINLGGGGDLVQQVLWRLDRATVDFSEVRRVVLVVGTNNLADGAPACVIVEGIISLVARLRDKVPQAQLTVVPMPPRRRWLSQYEGTRRAANQQLEQLARQAGFEILALPDRFACALPWPLPCRFYQWDGVHLSEAAYAALDQALAQTNRRTP